MAPNSIVENGAGAGLEPARFEGGDFKSLCLPISPPGHVRNNRGQVRDWQEKTESLLYFQSVLISISIN